MRAIGYLRVSTQEQAASGAGLAAQEQAIHAELDRRGWTLEAMESDAVSGKSMDNREGLERAISALKAGDADVIVIARLDRLIRSVADFATLLERSRAEGWSIVALDMAGVDTTTATGEFIATVMAAVAQLERRVNGERTKAALAERKRNGVKLGRPVTVPRHVEDVVAEYRRRGLGATLIARKLGELGYVSPNGQAVWAPSSVKRIVKRVGSR